MRGCAAPRPGQGGTWISRRDARRLPRLHELGYAHSVEAWIDGELAGGLYGVAIGRVFFGESMFARAPDASKIALVGLVRRLAADGFGLIDCQMHTAHLASLGAREIPARGVRPPGQGLGRLSAVAGTLARGGAGLTKD